MNAISCLWVLLWCMLLGEQWGVTAITLDINSPDSIKQAAKIIATDMLTFYPGENYGQVPGLLPQPPYYWWEGGAMMGSLIDYWYYTGDTQFNQLVTKAMLFQVGPANNFMPPNQTKSLGNDDQAFWGMAAMSAAEDKFPNPQPGAPQWLALAQAVFNSQANRWDNATCGGGLRWQIFTFNQGYEYKNSISNGCFFNMAARLGVYTGNQTYFDWANRMWDWVTATGLIGPAHQVFDGTQATTNCSGLNHIQWTYNSGVFLHGAAMMWNGTKGPERSRWEERVRGLLTGIAPFFKNNVMYEAACEPAGNCDTDQLSFKAYLARWMATSIKVAPFVQDLVSAQLKASALAAATSCSGGLSGNFCSMKWTEGSFNGVPGVGQQMSALETIQGLLIDSVPGPVTSFSGGISKGNPSAGSGSDKRPGQQHQQITAASRAGAGITTAILLISLLGGGWWMIS